MPIGVYERKPRNSGGQEEGGQSEASEKKEMTRAEIGEVLLTAWAELMPDDEYTAMMDAWVYEWIRREWMDAESRAGK